MNVEELRAQVARWFTEHASELRLASPARVDYVENLGGFVCANYTLTDGARAYHVKLAPDEGYLAGLRRWESVHELLSARYRAPRVLGWLSIGGWDGLLLEHLEGTVAQGMSATHVIAEVVEVADRLHADRELAERLGDGERAARETFAGYFLEICGSDLRELTEERRMPPFVSEETQAWMREELARVEELASSAVFDEPVSSAIHGDLWPGNILVEDGTWHIVDWDDIGIGDPVLDLALVTFDEVIDGEPREGLLGERDEGFWQRYEVSLRATALIGVIDSLADWSEAEKAPAIRDRVRAQKEQDHRESLALYRARYG